MLGRLFGGRELPIRCGIRCCSSYKTLEPFPKYNEPLYSPPTFDRGLSEEKMLFSHLISEYRMKDSDKARYSALRAMKTLQLTKDDPWVLAQSIRYANHFGDKFGSLETCARLKELYPTVSHLI